MRPRLQPPTGIRLASVAPRNLLVQLEPSREGRRSREPHRSGIIDVAHRDHAAGPHDPAHLPERGDRVPDMLQDLMRMGDVERVVVEGDGVHITDQVLGSGRIRRSSGDDLSRRIQAHHSPRRQATGELRGDGARAAAGVEERRARAEVRLEVGRGIGDGTPGVRSQHALVVTVGVPLTRLRHEASLGTSGSATADLG